MWRRQQPYWHAVFAIVWGAAVVVTLLDDPGPHGRGPSLALLGVIAAAYAVLGTRAMTHRDLRWAVAYQLVAWSALLAIQWVDPSTQAWLLYFTLFPQLWAMVPTRWAAIGTVARRRRVLPGAVGAERLRRRHPHRDPHLRHHLDGPVALARALHQPDRRRGREPCRDDRRAAGHPGPARRRRARPRRPRGARAHLARDPRHPRAGLHLGGRPLPRRPGRAGPRRPGHGSGSGSRSSSTRHPTTSTRPGSSSPSSRPATSSRAPSARRSSGSVRR